MELTINPMKSSLEGEITAPSSKSYSHRAFIAASLAEGISIIKKPLLTGDVKVTIDILKLLGVRILQIGEDSYLVEKYNDKFNSVKQPLDCKNSGTSLRIFAALSLVIKGGLILKGEFLNRERPILPLLSALQQLGATYNLKKQQVYIRRTKRICENLKIPGDISSQFITALMFLCPILKCKKKNYLDIELTLPIVSYPYIKITIDVLNSFGINIQEYKEYNKFTIILGQKYRAQLYQIYGDFSSVAFIITASILSEKPSKVTINNLNFQDSQGDKLIIEILQRMGANILVNKDKNQISINSNLKDFPLKGLEIDCSQTPDLFPILAVTGAFAEDKTTLYNISRIRLKESDRVSIISRELQKMGVHLEETKDKLVIYHCNNLQGATIEHGGDHRIAMAFIIAGLYCNSPLKINNIEIIEDSYPDFIKDLNTLGAKNLTFNSI
jgi:3-phosphoshikimate 1-carboxyvinyltransferase